ncbi:MAG: hypothetical protein JSV64_04530 [Candidatus Bathyarchaeota archaeon]|nr:MAG: hypothetical protein JSV64_04530 [Candidatus Bathyarchaeota archaeon]
MRAFVRDKRAVTPVLSNVLLTVVAVAAMSLAASATYVITDNMRQIMGERMILEDIWFTSESISVYLRNTGKVALEVSSVYVNHENQPFKSQTLEAGEHGWVNISFVWDTSKLYHVSVSTTRGTQVTEYYRAPTT